jgi:hypothetical protein
MFASWGQKLILRKAKEMSEEKKKIPEMLGKT